MMHRTHPDPDHSSEPPSEAPAWSAEHLADPHRLPDKASRVQGMFARIAPTYDLNNRLHSLGLDQAWRRAAVNLCGVRRGEVVLDVACGTADLAVAFAAAGAGRVIGLDFVHAMLRLARQKAGRRSHQGCAVELICGDATSLPLADHSVDIVSIAFGLRNVDQPDQALREFARVLRPGGRLMILEFAQPTVPLLGRLFRFYFHHVMPRTATWISGDRAGAYRYLPQSVRSFHTPEEIAALIETQGMTVLAQRRFSLGIAVATLAYQDD